MSTRSSRLPVSTANAVLVGLFAAGAAGTALAGQWQEAILLGLMGGSGLATALVARRRSASDVTRVNAIEYRDERDRQIARGGFAVVGAVALGLSVVQVVAASLSADGLTGGSSLPLLATGQLVLLCLVWAAANQVAATRH